MSAIAGVVFLDGQDVGDALLAELASAAPRRGFDGETRWKSGAAGMIRFAHATTPEAVGEIQPFESERTVLLFDGRLDNREELGAAPGQRDGEIALALYDRLGDEFVHRLAGDFAIVVWRPAERRLALFRSAMGWRPLYWAFDGKRFGFATDLRTLALGLGLDRKLNEGLFGEYLSARLVTQTDTFWHGIQRVVQGGAVILENGRARDWLWHGGPFEDLTDVSMEEHVERFKALFDEALIAANRSSGPVTSQLSGGLDSSSVVCRSAELYREGRLAKPVGAISARFPGRPQDESKWSSAVEAHSGVRAEVSTAVPFSAEAAQQWAADTYYMPIRPNVLDTLAGACAMLRADGRRVLLTGEGGDDWMSGQFTHWPDLFLRGKWVSLFKHGAQQWPDSRIDVMARRTIFAAVMPVISPRYRQALLTPHLDFRLFGTDWIRPEWAAKIGLEDRWRATTERPGLKGFTQKSRYSVFQVGGRYANFEGPIAYAETQGVEMRHPFHDVRLTRFFMGASGNLMRAHGLRKLLLREAMRGTLPEIVRLRTDKTVFVEHTVKAIDALFEARPAHELLPAKLGWIDPDRIAALHAPFTKWRLEGANGPVPESPWGPVWFALATDMWLQHAFKL